MRQEIVKLIDSLFAVQESGKAQVFIHFYGHVSELKVNVYSPSYHRDLKPIMEAKIYTDSTNKKEFDNFKRKVNSTIDLFVDIQDKVII
jgi:hypothetical protein